MKHAGISSASKLALSTECTHWVGIMLPNVPRGAPLAQWNKAWNALPVGAPNKYMIEGTNAHRLLELRLKQALCRRADKAEIERLTVTLLRRSVENVDKAYEFVTSLYEHRAPCYIYLEKKSIWSDDIWGTSDIVVYSKNDSRGVLDVIDFKNGSGVGVKAYKSLQCAAYAGGLLGLPGKHIDDIVIWIVQPSHPDAKEAIQKWGTTPVEVFDMLRAAEIALEKIPSKPNVGPHCDRHFCPARDVCNAYNAEQKEDGVIDADAKITDYVNKLKEMNLI